MTNVPPIKQREIEANLAVAMIHRYAEVLGQPKAIVLASGCIQDLAENAGRKLADQMGNNPLEDLARVVREVWAREDALGITFHAPVTPRSPGGLIPPFR